MPNDLPNGDDSEIERRLESEREWRDSQAKSEREGVAKSKELFAATEAYQAKQMQAAKKRSAAERAFAEAAEFAKRQIRDNELEGEVRPYYEVRYTVAQGLKAAIHGREDGIATLMLQRDILVRLDALRTLLWVAVALLAFVAYKVA